MYKKTFRVHKYTSNQTVEHKLTLPNSQTNFYFVPFDAL